MPALNSVMYNKRAVRVFIVGKVADAGDEIATML